MSDPLATMDRPADAFFNNSLSESDSAVFGAIQQELGRQQAGDRTDRLREHRLARRARGAGLDHDQQIRGRLSGPALLWRLPVCRCRRAELAIDRVTRLFDCAFANVQPNSGSQANQSVMLALAKPGDTILGMSLDAGGHLTHGARPNLSGKVVSTLSSMALSPRPVSSTTIRSRRWPSEHKPAIIIAGGSAYSRNIDFARFREIADRVEAYLWVDMAHFAGLVAGGVNPSPFPHAHVVTSTTHKTLRGPRGGLVLTNDADIAKKINSAVFPGLQGGPLMHVIAAKAVAFGEALTPEFAAYTEQVVENAKVLASTLVEGGLDIVSGGTDTHLMLVDLRPKQLTGNVTEAALGRAFITCNKNGVPNDPQKPTITSGMRLGTPAATTRGFGPAEFREVGKLIIEVLDGLRANRGFAGGQCPGRTGREEESDRADRSFPDLSGPLVRIHGHRRAR